MELLEFSEDERKAALDAGPLDWVEKGAVTTPTAKGRCATWRGAARYHAMPLLKSRVRRKAMIVGGARRGVGMRYAQDALWEVPWAHAMAIACNGCLKIWDQIG